ncbi:MAG: hypothetical protein JSW07_09565, partial [bacterium]
MKKDLEDGKYQEVLASTDQIKESILNAKDAHREDKSKVLVLKIKSLIDESRDIGIDTTKLEDLMAVAEKELEKNNFSRLEELVRESEELFEDLKNKYSRKKAEDSIKNAEDAIIELEKVDTGVLDTVIAAYEKINNAKFEFDKKNYEAAIELSEQIIDYVKKSEEDFHEKQDEDKKTKAINEMLDVIKSKIDNAKKIGCDTSKSENIYESTKKELEAKNFEKSIDLATMGMAQIEEDQKRFEGKNALELCKSKIKLLKGTGWETTELKKLRKILEDSFKKQDIKNIKIFTAQFIDSVDAILQTKPSELRSSIESIINDAKALGVDVSEQEPLVANMNAELDKENYLAAIEISEDIEIQIAESKADAEEILGMIKLPFTHGIEMEVMLVKEDGHWLEGGERLKKIYIDLVQEAKDELQKLLKTERVPRLIKQKAQFVDIEAINTPGHIRGNVVVMDYLLNDEPIKIELIGRDPQGVGVTWILEITTPPCEYLDELIWWSHNLYRICNHAVEKMEDVALLSTGLNPVEEYTSGISFGDHHHIGIPNVTLRKNVYNMLRNYVPQLIALNVNSPFEGARDPGIKITSTKNS